MRITKIDDDEFAIIVDGKQAALMELDVEEGYLHGIQTYPAYRRRGYCRRLVEFAMNECGELVIFTNNPILTEMLTRMGWTEKPSVMAGFQKMVW